MKMTEIRKAEGIVDVWLSASDGRVEHIDTVHNTATYGTADAAARAYAGDLSMIPQSIVFLYDNDPDSTSMETLLGNGRSLVWEDVIEEFGENHTDPEIPFSYAPSIESSDTDKYSGNKVVLHGVTQDVDENSVNSVYIHGACLVGKSGQDYRLLAIVDLGSKMKPADFELSIDWAVKFN